VGRRDSPVSVTMGFNEMESFSSAMPEIGPKASIILADERTQRRIMQAELLISTSRTF
jgi:hypothetical protein